MSVTKGKVKELRADIGRMIVRLDEWEAAQSTYQHGEYTFDASTPRESGAVNRESMNLTRALARFRKP